MGSSRANHFLDLADKEHLLVNRSIYIPLFLMLLLDNTNVAYLPWLSSKFSTLSDGYPDMRVYKMCVCTKILQSFIVVVIQIVVLCQLQGHGFRSLNLDTKVFLCISIASSTISFVVTAVGVVLQASLLKAMTDDDDDRGSSVIDVNNPMRATRIGKLSVLLLLSL